MSILICFDGSDSARRAVAVCGRTLSQTEMTLLHVWAPPVEFLADSFSDGDKVITPLAELEPISSERAEAIVRQGAELAGDLGLTVSTRVERCDSSVWRTILDIADSSGAELIVLGTHGHTAVETNLLGSVANGVAHHSTLPVLIVPASTTSGMVSRSQPAVQTATSP